jgi:hypothetical protein
VDTSDKSQYESWTQYWDRKRRERHGAGCRCRLCLMPPPKGKSPRRITKTFLRAQASKDKKAAKLNRIDKIINKPKQD